MIGLRAHIPVMKNLALSDEEAAVLVCELTDITWNNRFQLAPRIRTLKAILAKLKAEPARGLLPPRKHHTPP
jgi:hypothetical protein